VLASLLIRGSSGKGCRAIVVVGETEPVRKGLILCDGGDISGIRVCDSDEVNVFRILSRLGYRCAGECRRVVDICHGDREGLGVCLTICVFGPQCHIMVAHIRIGRGSGEGCCAVTVVIEIKPRRQILRDNGRGRVAGIGISRGDGVKIRLVLCCPGDRVAGEDREIIDVRHADCERLCAYAVGSIPDL